VTELSLTLPPEILDAIAERVAELLAGRFEAPAATSPFMTIPEATEYIRASSRQRVDDLLSSGRLTRHKDGSRTLVSRAELAAYLLPNGSRPGTRSGFPR
jgi:excisionase family DNA binding protein